MSSRTRSLGGQVAGRAEVNGRSAPVATAELRHREQSVATNHPMHSRNEFKLVWPLRNR